MGETSMFYGASPKIFEMAKDLRSQLTKAESLLWEKLRLKRLRGYRFKPQHPIGSFIVDFYCHRAKLVIEVDGMYHGDKEQTELDANRTFELKSLGLMVIDLIMKMYLIELTLY
jgi:very-short-patch-repair endonuclease